MAYDPQGTGLSDPFSSAIPPWAVTGGHSPGAGAQSSQDIPFLAGASSQSPLRMHKVQTGPCPALFLWPRFPSSFVEAAQPELPELWVLGPE